ncbi:MAG: hypothetical protein II388_10005, partial [Clostridia bacterium]|nr:hypothetical protein [Clostridia bacterium]
AVKEETKAAKAVKAVEEKKAEVKVEAPVVEEKKAEVKAEAPVVEEKKETKTAKKPAAKKAAKAPETAVTDVVVEFNGVQNACKEVVENVKKTYAAQGNTDEIKTLKVYIKPQENAAYSVVNDTIEGKMDVYF